MDERVTLQSADGVCFTLNLNDVKKSKVVDIFIQARGTEDPFTVKDSTESILRLIVVYLSDPEKLVLPESIVELDQLLFIADWMDIQGLIDLVATAIAHKLRGRSRDEILKIVSPLLAEDKRGAFTEEEKQEIDQGKEGCEEIPL